MPSLQSIYQHFRGKPFTVVAIDIREERDTVIRRLQADGISYPNLLDSDGTVSALYGVSSTPVKFLIDREGNMIAAALGYRDWDQKEFRKLIELLIR